jgi:hypothetical protein
MVQARLRWWLESFNKLNLSHAGFRANRLTEEQVVRVALFTMDGLNAVPRKKRTLITLMDFSKAYDSV